MRSGSRSRRPTTSPAPTAPALPAGPSPAASWHVKGMSAKAIRVRLETGAVGSVPTPTPRARRRPPSPNPDSPSCTPWPPPRSGARTSAGSAAPHDRVPRRPSSPASERTRRKRCRPVGGRSATAARRSSFPGSMLNTWLGEIKLINPPSKSYSC